MTLQELGRLAEVLGATVIPDPTDGPEFVFDAEAFERFTDAVFRKGVEHGLDLAQQIVDSAKTGGVA